MARTIILAWVIGLLGLVMIGGGIWGLIDLFRQEVRAPLKSYGGAVSMICGGIAMFGRGAAVARRARSYSDARPLSEVRGSDEGWRACQRAFHKDHYCSASVEWTFRSVLIQGRSRCESMCCYSRQLRLS